MHDIRLVANICGNVSMGWKKYDKQFKHRCRVDPSILWSKIDHELWLIFMQSQKQFKALQASVGPYWHNKCFNFNYKSHCYRPDCQNSHTCIKCGWAHPQQTYPKLGNIAQSQSSVSQFSPPGKTQPRNKGPTLSSPTNPQSGRPQKYMSASSNT